MVSRQKSPKGRASGKRSRTRSCFGAPPLYVGPYPSPSSEWPVGSPPVRPASDWNGVSRGTAARNSVTYDPCLNGSSRLRK